MLLTLHHTLNTLSHPPLRVKLDFPIAVTNSVCPHHLKMHFLFPFSLLQHVQQTLCLSFHFHLHHSSFLPPQIHQHLYHVIHIIHLTLLHFGHVPTADMIIFFVSLITFAVPVVSLVMPPTYALPNVYCITTLIILLMTTLPLHQFIITPRMTILHGTLRRNSLLRNPRRVPCQVLIFHNTYTLFFLYHALFATRTPKNTCTLNSSLPSSLHPYLTLLEQHTLLTFFCNVQHHHPPSSKVIASTSRLP